MRARRLKRFRVGWVWLCLLVAACASRTAAPTAAPATTLVSGLVTPPASRVPAPTPTPTPEPLAATVNGEAIPLAAYEREVARCQAGRSAAGLDPANCRADVLQSLVEQKAVEQAALAAGLAVSDADVQAALARLEGDLGGPEKRQAWLAANLYTDDEFRRALQLDLLQARMIEQVGAQVGDAAEQVHARALLVADETTAQQLLAQLQAGADFATLALGYSRDLSSRPAGGDLGWFPRGLLTTPEVEQAAFALDPGQMSGVISSALGYHIVQTLERDPARPLSPGAEQALRQRAYENWLKELLARVVVQRFVNP